MTIKNFNFHTADEMIRQKEELLKRTIDKYFDGWPWNEETIEKEAIFEVTPDGTETFKIKDIDLIRFHPIQSNYVVENDRMYITLDQPYEILFGSES